MHQNCGDVKGITDKQPILFYLRLTKQNHTEHIMRIQFYILILIFTSIRSFGQLTNADFENWNTISSEKIDVWTSQGNVTKVAGQQGNYGISMQTDPQAGSGIVFLSFGFQSGFPYFDKIDTIKLWVNCEW